MIYFYLFCSFVYIKAIGGLNKNIEGVYEAGSINSLVTGKHVELADIFHEFSK